MWENAEEMGGCLREYSVLGSREPPPPTCGTQARAAGPPSAHVLVGGGDM